MEVAIYMRNYHLMEMKHFRLGSKLQYRTFGCSTFIFNISVVQNEHQEVLAESLRLSPDLVIEESVDLSDGSRYLRVNVPGDVTFEIDYSAEVALSPCYSPPATIEEVPHSVLPLDVVPYLYPSRYCESDRLSRLALVQFGYLHPGYSRVQGICNWIYDNVAYLSGSTNHNTSAFDTVTERVGVCRDFAHLGIAFCRALSVPARFVGGYAVGLDPPDFHAVFEAYLGGRWYLFDPTRLVPLDHFVRVGTGHDAADVSFATIFGPAEMSQMLLRIEVGGGEATDSAVTAISTMAAGAYLHLKR